MFGMTLHPVTTNNFIEVTPTNVRESIAVITGCILKLFANSVECPTAERNIDKQAGLPTYPPINTTSNLLRMPKNH